MAVNVNVDLHDANGALVAAVRVDAASGLPGIITYLGNSYAWSTTHQHYRVQTPVAGVLDATAPKASVTAWPPF